MFGKSSRLGSNRGSNKIGSSTFGKKRRGHWIFINRRKHKHHHENTAEAEDGSVIMTTDSPAVESISGVSYDISDERRPSQIVFSSTPSKSRDEDTIDSIELANKDPKANGEKQNGVNHKYKDTYQDNKADNDGCVKCIYIAQQCCECVIV